MQQFFLLLYQYRATLIFILFEVFCAWLIVQNNFYQRAKFFNSSSAVAANILGVSSNVSDYFGLKKVNEKLAEENAQLREMFQNQLLSIEKPDSIIYNDTVSVVQDTIIVQDTIKANQFEFISAKVIGNSIRRINNYITINKGANDGIERGMGVIGPNGVVGSVKDVSNNFSVINSMLHSNIQVSAKISRTEDIGTIRWEWPDFSKGVLEYVPRHVELQPGDTVVTSGFNSLFPEGIMIGVIDQIEEREETQFYDITVNLAVVFNELSYVYIIRNTMRPELDSLKTETIEWLQQE